MLEFAEKTLFAIKRLEKETQDRVVSGAVKDMEQVQVPDGPFGGVQTCGRRCQRATRQEP